jgi:hypothetical protein
VLSATNVTINAGEEATISVRWTSNLAINFLSTPFQLTSVNGQPAGISFKVDSNNSPIIPAPLTDSNYVFFGNSFAQTQPSTPISVYQTDWENDSFLMVDETSDLSDAPQNGTKIWITIAITSLPTTFGTYKLELNGAEYNTSQNAGAPFILSNGDMEGGLITINSINNNVPEPTMTVIGSIFLGAFGWQQFKRRSNALLLQTR